MKKFYRTLFLARGTTFHIHGYPGSELANPALLLSQDYTEVLSASLVLAQQGRFDHFGRTLELLESSDNGELWNSAITLLSYAAPYSIIKDWLNTFHDDLYVARAGWVQNYAFRMLSGCKGLWAVQEMLKIFQMAAGVEQIQVAPVYLSYLLENDWASVFDGPSIDMDQNDVPDFVAQGSLLPSIEESEKWRQLCELRFNDLSESAIASGADPYRVAVFEGEILDVAEVCHRLLRRVKSGIDTEQVEVGRMLIEANTGLDCSEFFGEDLRLKPLSAAALVEELLSTHNFQSFEKGVRYFFGHRIPD